MFKCENCKNQVAVNQPMNRVVTERRTKHYENVMRRGRDRGRINYTTGWEVVTEIAACPRCYLDLTGLEPRTKEPTPPRKFHPRFRDEESTRKWGRSKQQQDRKESKKPVVEVINPITLEKS